MNTEDTIAIDKAHLWHPFTQHQEWCAPGYDPLVIVSAEGALLRDSEGRDYIDGNSSIWTNLHGHRHPRIDAAIRAQLEQAAHTSFLGFTHPLAAELARPNTGKTVYILDEPTTGLHFDDIRKLLEVLNRLVDLGNTVIVVEHDRRVIARSDWTIDVGPGAGDDGGRIVYAGSVG